MSSERTETVVVGAGPIGLEVAAALRRAGRPCVQIDAGQIGSTIQWWAPGTQFFSSPERIAIAGVPFVTERQEKGTREAYLAYLRQVAAMLDLSVRTFERVVDVERLPDGTDGERFLLHTERHGVRRELRCRNVVLAIGNMHGPLTIDVPGENLPHVSHDLGDVHQYFDERVCIVGGRNSACEAAIRLHRLGAQVTLAYRRRELPSKVKPWIRPELVGLIKEDRIGWRPEPVVERIAPDAVHLRASPFAEERDAEWRGSVPADHVLLLTGYVQSTSLFERAGVELTGRRRRPVFDEDTMQTNVEGIYVAGTASAGTQSSGVTVFIETSHVHAERIAAHIAGETTHVRPPNYVLEES